MVFGRVIGTLLHSRSGRLVKAGLRKRTGVREASGWFRSKQPDSDEDGQEDEEDDEEEHKEVGVDVVH